MEKFCLLLSIAIKSQMQLICIVYNKRLIIEECSFILYKNILFSNYLQYVFGGYHILQGNVQKVSKHELHMFYEVLALILPIYCCNGLDLKRKTDRIEPTEAPNQYTIMCSVKLFP